MCKIQVGCMRSPSALTGDHNHRDRHVRQLMKSGVKNKHKHSSHVDLTDLLMFMKNLMATVITADVRALQVGIKHESTAAYM